jgi:hypothetical protein
MDPRRRLRSAWLITVFLAVLTAHAAEPMVRIDSVPSSRTITHLSWDTEGGTHSERNLLREPIVAARAQPDGAGGFRLVSVTGDLRLPFDPVVTPTSIIPARWHDDGTFELPAILNSPDFGPLVVTQIDGPALRGRFEGDRKQKRADVLLQAAGPATLQFRPLLLPAPEGLRDPRHWPLARRGWLNAIQPTSRWGEQNRPFSAPPGVLGNNTISDPASCSLWFYADQAFFIPEPFPGVNLMPLVRRSIEYWIDTKMIKDATGAETGELICYWNYAHFLDANAGPLIAAWDYVEATDDRDWLIHKIGRLEKVADFLLSRDIDGDGLIEATQSGNLGTLKQPNRSCAWWDAVNCGHKDAYTNALCYRALRCLADLEARIGRTAEAARYTAAADRLKASFFPTLYNEKTGLLGWWRSEDGTLHDYAAPTVCGLAIDYGLVPAAAAQAMLDRLWRKMEEVQFTRLDLGLPTNLIPFHPGAYLQPAFGGPTQPDGRDTFGLYMNGGISAGQSLHFIAAHYHVGDTARGDRVLEAMLPRQFRGEFQNGVRDEPSKGIDWTTWDGQPSGYEGYLADSFRFLQAVLMREPALRRKLLHPVLR